MIRGAVFGALAALPFALAAGGCQTSQPTYTSGVPQSTGMEGTWSSADGVFVATFANGNFTSRFTQTNEVLAQGTYTVTGGTVSLVWISVASQQQRSAVCTIATPDTVSCSQADGSSFDLKRAA
jgi:hypothetical protein